MWRPRVMIPAVAAAIALVAGTLVASPASVAAPSAADDVWVVALGDSYISGEGGRWAGNETGGTSHIDALGKSAYWDAGNREAIERCHRSASADIHIGVVHSLNLACSGATTGSGGVNDKYWKPGIDFVSQGDRKGQALMLQEFAATHNVKMVALSIGGNDFHFGDIVEACVKSFLYTVVGKCRNDADVTRYINEASQARVRADVAQAIENVATAMARAGRSPGDWTLVLQLYPQPLPHPSNMRYSQWGPRQKTGGCGFWNDDLDWALDKVLPTVNNTVLAAARDAKRANPPLRISYMDTTQAFKERKLCHVQVERVHLTNWLGNFLGVENWKDPQAVDRSEWVMEINIFNLGDTYKQESLHPSYWGQLALRNCWRQAWNGGTPQGGECQRGNGLNRLQEPNMKLTGNPLDFRIRG